jgi:hypothetical protein
VIFMQIEMRDLARARFAQTQPLPPRYLHCSAAGFCSDSRLWLGHGYPVADDRQAV